MSTVVSPSSQDASDREERSPKRRRISRSDDDELQQQRSSSNEQEPRSPSNLKSQPTPARPPQSPTGQNQSDEEDSRFLQTPRAHRRRHASTPGTSADEAQESENTDFGSSPAPQPPQHEPLNELHYHPRLILRGHKRAVSCVKFSPNGKFIASASADATAKIWDSATGKHLHTLHGHLAGISTLAFSPDSSLLATGSDDKSIRFWSVSTGKAFPKALRGHHNYILSIAFSPKGNMLVSGSQDEAVHVWDVRAARLMRSLPAHSDPVGGVDFARDGTLIVSCSTDGLIRVWDTATGQCLRTFFHEDTPPVCAVRFSPNGRFIAAWMLDDSVRLWNYVEGRCVKTFQGHTNQKFSIGGSFGSYEGDDEDGERVVKGFLVSGGEQGEVVFWDVVSKEMLQRLGGHDGTVFAVDTHPSEKKIVSCGADKTIRVWEAREVINDVEEEVEERHLEDAGGEPVISVEDVEQEDSLDVTMHEA